MRPNHDGCTNEGKGRNKILFNATFGRVRFLHVTDFTMFRYGLRRMAAGRATHGQVISDITIGDDVFHIQAKKRSVAGYLKTMALFSDQSRPASTKL